MNSQTRLLAVLLIISIGLVGYANSRNSDAPGFSIVSQQIKTLPALETTMETRKLLNSKTGQWQMQAFDADGNAVNYASQLQQEHLAYQEKYCALQPDFYSQLMSTKDGTFLVMLQLAIDETFIDKSLVAAEKIPDLIGPQALAEEERVLAQAHDLFSQLAATYRIKQTPTSISGPFVFIELSKAEILKIACDRKIIFIGEVPPIVDPPFHMVCSAPDIPSSLPSTQTDLVHFSTQGSGVNVAVLERGNLDKPQSCFNLADIRDPMMAMNTGSPEHLANVVGIIGNTFDGVGADDCDASPVGYAPAASIMLANFSPTMLNYQDGYDWAKSKLSNIVNMSWSFASEGTSGDLSTRDKYFDYQVTRFPFPSVFSSAGNDGMNFVKAKGYNYMAVANVTNNADGDICDDPIRPSSSWVNPTHAMRELPEIAAPGSWHCVMDRDFGGTSAATPVMSSIAALMMSENQGLKYWPQAIRAILMAASTYQDSDGMDWTDGSGSDGQDGVGMINAAQALDIATNRETTPDPSNSAHDFGTITQSSFSTDLFGNNILTKEWTVSVVPPLGKVRVAFTWDSKVTNTTDTMLDLDLDLSIYDSGDNQVAYSLSTDDNYEFVEFVPPASGQYRIEIFNINSTAFPATFSRHYAVAWTHHTDCP